jgi:putative methyltransferase
LTARNKKTIVICNFPRFSGEIWLPYLWASAKTYYEKYGKRTDEWSWHPCYVDVYSSEYKDNIKEILLAAKPDIFAISLYVWNYTLAYEMALWVKEQFPKCIIISGGPHQYFKHDINWFKEHWYLDASLPGDCYGELCFSEILDNYDNITQSINWDTVTDIVYPSAAKNIKVSKLSMAKADKKKFQYDWSALHSQHTQLIDFIDYQREKFPKSILLSVIETTRGCPYGCTYCDWGGGTATTVIKKSIENVKLDIDAVAQFDLTFLYFADANFGIFGDRDIGIIEYLVKRKKETGQMFKIGYGGFAKTENKLGVIRDILRIDFDNSLSLTKELKLSMQTLDDTVLHNIDRKNISLEKQLEVFEPLARDKQMPVYVEMIMGLPGITLDKYYYELNVLGQHNLSVQWFEWILLPETPAYATAYRTTYGIQTIVKNKGWAVVEEDSEREVVVGCSSFSKNDYLQMQLSNSLYHLIIQGGFYKESIQWILTTHNIGHGDLIRNIYENYFLININCSKYKNQVMQRWESILTDNNIPCTFDIDNENIYGGWYFVALAFLNANFVQNLIEWLQSTYNIPTHIVTSNSQVNIHADNFGKIKLSGASIINYKKPGGFQTNSVHSMIGLFINHVDTGKVFRGKKKLFGLIRDNILC